MARVFQTFKMHTDSSTRKRVDLLDGKGKKIPHPRWRFEIIDWQGKHRIKTGYPTKSETEKLAQRVQSQEDEIRKGYRPPPKSADKHALRPFSEVIDEYIAWGESQGGRGGRAWGSEHLRKRLAGLKWWGSRLKLNVLVDINNVLPKVEAALRDLQKVGRSGKTLSNYAEAIKSFCEWCTDRNYLEINPLKRWV